jgi:hypothetical protein
VLIDRDSLSEHLPWIVACLVVTGLAIFWFVAASAGQAGWPGGSSPPGFTFGILGGLICLYEFLLWPRKKVRTWRIGRVQVWMRAHIWLGLLAVPLLVLHTGFTWGGALSMTLMILFLVVIASGIWGLVLQQFLPKVLLAEIPAETIYSQIERVAGQYAEESERLVEAICGAETTANGTAARPAAVHEEKAPMQFLVVGAVRAAGGVQGKVVDTRAPASPVPESEELRRFFRASVKPYLVGGRKTGSPLRDRLRATSIFQEVRFQVPPGAQDAVATLESLCDQRRQLDRQVRLHHWLHGWLWVHLPLSVALIVLMFIHIFVAIKYW